MRTKNALLNKSNCVSQINKVFDQELIEKLAVSCGLIIRQRVLKAWDFFFSVYLPINVGKGLALKVCVVFYLSEGFR